VINTGNSNLVTEFTVPVLPAQSSNIPSSTINFQPDRSPSHQNHPIKPITTANLPSPSTTTPFQAIKDRFQSLQHAASKRVSEKRLAIRSLHEPLADWETDAAQPSSMHATSFERSCGGRLKKRGQPGFYL
jgi:hypothetical protein